jgi:hypothetical protein
MEASAAGQPLYKSFGYEPVRDIVTDTKPFGRDGVDIHVVSTA